MAVAVAVPGPVRRGGGAQRWYGVLRGLRGIMWRVGYGIGRRRRRNPDSCSCQCPAAGQSCAAGEWNTVSRGLHLPDTRRPRGHAGTGGGGVTCTGDTQHGKGGDGGAKGEARPRPRPSVLF